MWDLFRGSLIITARLAIAVRTPCNTAITNTASGVRA